MATAFLHLFEDKLEKLKKDIKQLKKEHPEKKESIKVLLKDAKKLRDTLEKIPKEKDEECVIILTPISYETSNKNINVISHKFEEDGSIKLKIRINKR